MNGANQMEHSSTAQEHIILDHVTFSFGDTVVIRDISLALRRGGTYALIGKSGIGKSTLLNLIAGFLQPDHGLILIDGAPVSGPRRQTAFLFQELGLFPWQTVSEAVSMPLKIAGKKRESNAQAQFLLKELHLEQHKDKYPQQLSGGERQRVALARTLMNDPDLLLMDEPTSALDAMTKEELQTLILRQTQMRGATLLFVTHDIEEAVLLGQTILILNEDGTLSSIENPCFGIPNPRETLAFYDECIKIRTRLRIEP